MLTTIRKMMAGESSVVENFEAASKKWADFFNENNEPTADQMARWISDNQMDFERHCGGKDCGAEAMVWTSYPSLSNPNDGFGENRKTADLLAEAFERSTVTGTIKADARQASKFFL